MAGSCREIVTLQLGHYSNFIGTHWWNIQDSSFAYNPNAVATNEINHDVLFREGCNPSGEVTYTPRLLLFDLKGSLNTLKQNGQLYDVPDAAEDLQWGSDVTMHKAETLPKNDYLQDLEKLDSYEVDERDEGGDKEDQVKEPSSNQPPMFGKRLHHLDDQVRVWSDFLRLHLHPKTVHVVQQYWHDSDSEIFDVHNLGESVVNDHHTHNEIEDRLHFFLEECDNLQGLHILCDPGNGFGGMAAKLAEELSDEFASKSIVVIPAHEPEYTKKPQSESAVSLVSNMLSYSSLLEHASAVIPLSVSPCLFTPSFSNPFPHLSPKFNLAYHSSAVLACAVESLSLPYRRLGPDSCLMPHLTEALTPAGRKLLNLQMALPFPGQPDVLFDETLSGLGDRLPWRSLTPYCHRNQEVDGGQSVVFQGVELHSGTQSCEKSLLEYLQKINSSPSAVTTLKKACNVTEPFPHFFNTEVSSKGLLSAVHRDSNTGVESVPLLTSLQSSSGVSAILDQMLQRTKKVELRKLHRCEKAGLDEDAFKECVVRLQSLHEEYSL
ncbi:hypothetical protein CAPTEDRAFT_160708 [Capitella teleta]|uniref:Protein misato homolog 1 n=1 Tax=Capitella teleta TaxID=283909 RepID=R7UIG4_CAPTE|nr:hypothetical protein CAPTEDRAFT_160708 [Capitella teleta]|eukprot:ELU05985.1 hypothetical protein CAPTEDRAFT_160708 [Capitella teleta]